MLDLEAVFDDNKDEFLKDCRIDPARRLHPRPDLDAFLRLHSLVPEIKDMIAGAWHDEFCLSVDCEALAQSATADDVVDLIRCGVRYDRLHESLVMFA